jgi:glycosyltransferase involved in cell wall biosynthesis
MKVKYFPYQPHCFAFGGFEIQMLSTLNAVVKVGVDASKLDVWSRENNFDILHLWGVGPPNYQVIDWAKKSGKSIIATVLLPYHDTLRSKLGYIHRFFRIKELIKYYNKIDKIVVLNQTQSKILTRYYKIHPSRIEIIPNVVEDKYFKISGFNFSEKYGIENYVLCTGNISSRKNQYNLAVACTRLNLNLVLIGKVLDGEEAYGKELEVYVSKHKNILWIPELPNASEELVAAYYNCLLYALPSKNETQPISALEAVAMKKPLILMDRMYAHQNFYRNAVLSKSGLVKDIEAALKACLNNTTPPKENEDILSCRDENVGRLYKSCYLGLTKN